MNTTVNFELAKLLKEKRFDPDVYIGWYSISGSFFYHNPGMEKYFYNEDIKAPIIADVVMWLWEKHGIWIEVYYDNSKKEFYTVLDGEEYKFNLPAEAYTRAIDYCLNNLI